VRRTLEFRGPEGKEYRLNHETATLVVRPRGWHLPEKHLRIDRKVASGSLVDFGLYFFHNAKELLARGTGPYFYLPKMEIHLEPQGSRRERDRLRQGARRQDPGGERRIRRDLGGPSGLGPRRHGGVRSVPRISAESGRPAAGRGPGLGQETPRRAGARRDRHGTRHIEQHRRRDSVS